MKSFIRKTLSLTTLLFTLLTFSGCEENGFNLESDADEFFFLENENSLMPVWVQGNTASRIFLIHVHGGPGGESMLSFNIVGTKFTDPLESKYANVYYDQRNSGSSQGTSGKGNVTEEQMAEDLYKLILFLKGKYGQDIKVHILGTSWGGRLTAQYLINPVYQGEVSGWICVAGDPDLLTAANSGKDLLKYYADLYIASDQNVSRWTKIRDWTIENDTIKEEFVWLDQNSLAWDALDMVDDSLNHETEIKVGDILRGVFFSPFNITSTLIQEGNFPEEALGFFDDMGSSLNAVEVPSLFMYGKFDFVVPPATGQKAFDNVGSERKEFVIFEHSGHLIPFNETNKFVDVLIEFIDSI